MGEYHEHLDDLQYASVGKRFLEEMEYLGEGLHFSQYVIGRHTDREHEHIHIIASRIKMDATVVPDSWDYRKAEVAARKLEKEFGLEPTPCSNEKVVQKLQEIGIIASVSPTLRKPQTIKQLKHTSGKPPVAELIADAVDEACSDKPTFTQLVSRLKEKNIIVHSKLDNQNNILGIAYEMDNIKIPGYKIGKGYSFLGLQKYLGVVYGESRQQQSTTPQEEKLQQQYAETIAPIVRNFWHLQGRHKRYRSKLHELVLENDIFKLKRTSGEELALIPLDPSKPARGKNLTQDDVQIFLGYQDQLNEQVHSKQIKAQHQLQSRQQSYQKPQQLHGDDGDFEL